MSNPPLLVFDVNETLLDLGGMTQSLSRALDGREELFQLWFSTTLHYSVVETTGEVHSGFGELGAAALVMVAESNGITLGLDLARDVIREAFESLSPHEDVVPALETLKTSGYRMVCLTNSSTHVVEPQLRRMGLTALFETVYSVERVGKYKPHPATYQFVLDDMGAKPDAAMMVAAHPWDLLGASRVGLQTAFVARPGRALWPIADPPQVVVRDLSELADRLASKSSNVLIE